MSYPVLKFIDRMSHCTEIFIRQGKGVIKGGGENTHRGFFKCYYANRSKELLIRTFSSIDLLFVHIFLLIG